MIEEFVKRGNLRRFSSGLRSPFYETSEECWECRIYLDLW